MEKESRRRPVENEDLESTEDGAPDGWKVGEQDYVYDFTIDENDPVSRDTEDLQKTIISNDRRQARMSKDYQDALERGLTPEQARQFVISKYQKKNNRDAA